MKRKICSLVALSMLMATVAVPNYAIAETPDFSDYTQVEIPENLMTDPNKGDVLGNVNVFSSVT